MKKRNIAVIALVVVLLAAGFALPELVLGLRDAALEERRERVAVDTTPVGALAASLTWEEKLRMAGEVGATDLIPLNTGVHLTERAASRAAEGTMGDIAGLLHIPREWSCGEITPLLAVGSDGRSFVLWTAYLTAGELTPDELIGDLMLDDETGEVLSFAIYGDGDGTDPTRELDTVSLFDLAMTVLEPLGITPEGVDPDPHGGLVVAEGGNLTVRISVSDGNQPMLRVNAG